MNAFEFFIETLEYKRTPAFRSEDYIEGYADPIDSVLYAIRSGDVTNLFDLQEMLEYMDASSGDFSGEYGEGYKDAMYFILNQFHADY